MSVGILPYQSLATPAPAALQPASQELLDAPLLNPVLVPQSGADVGQLAGGVAPLGDPAPLAASSVDADGFTHDYPQGIKLLKNAWNPATETHDQADATLGFVVSQLSKGNTVNPDSYLLDTIQNQWASKRDATTQATLDKLISKLANKGYHVYDQTAYLAPQGELLFKELGPNDYELHYKLTGNSVDFTVEVPSNVRSDAAAAAAAAAAAEYWYLSPIASGAAATAAAVAVNNIPDPRFSATFDVEMVIEFHLNSTLDPSRNDNLEVRKAQVQIENAHVDSENYFADLIKDVDSVLVFAGDPGIFGPAEEAMQKGSPGAFGPDEVRASFQDVNDSLQQAAQAGYSQAESRVVAEGTAGKLEVELTQDIPQVSLHLAVKDLTSDLPGSAEQQTLVKTYVTVAMDGRVLKSMESKLFNPDIQPWVDAATPEELTRLEQSGTNFGMDFVRLGQHTIHVEIWRSVRTEPMQAFVGYQDGNLEAIFPNGDVATLPDNFYSLAADQQAALTTRTLNPPDGVQAGKVAAFDLSYDFRTRQVSGPFGIAKEGDTLILTSPGNAPATLTLTLGEDVAGKWTAAYDQPPVGPNQSDLGQIPNPNPEPGWDGSIYEYPFEDPALLSELNMNPSVVEDPAIDQTYAASDALMQEAVVSSVVESTATVPMTGAQSQLNQATFVALNRDSVSTSLEFQMSSGMSVSPKVGFQMFIL
jgi:hypothetical protein